MNPEKFRQRVEKEGGNLADYLDEVAQEAELDKTRSVTVCSQ